MVSYTILQVILVLPLWEFGFNPNYPPGFNLNPATNCETLGKSPLVLWIRFPPLKMIALGYDTLVLSIHIIYEAIMF